MQRFSQVVWVHVASLGEFEQASPLMVALKEKMPQIGLVLTFFSPSGFEAKKDDKIADLICYLPIDLPKNARWFLDQVRPDLALFVKYDFWYNYLHECTQRGIPIVYASALFRSHQVYFNRGKRLFLPLFRKIDRFFVQGESSAALLKNHKIEHVEVAGDTRVDRVIEIASTQWQNKRLSKFTKGKKVIVFGSIWPSDLPLVNAIMAAFPDFSYLLAPHEVDASSIKEVEEKILVPTRLLSNWDDVIAEEVLIVDSIGILSKLYRLSDYVYVGGAFQGAVHNTLEALAYGLPVFVGSHPAILKFKEIAELIEENGVFVTGADGSEMIDEIWQMENSPERYDRTRQKNRTYIQAQAGATTTIVEYLEQKLR